MNDNTAAAQTTQTQTPVRTMAEINAEYTTNCAKAGELSYKIKLWENLLQQTYTQINKLDQEAQEVKAVAQALLDPTSKQEVK